MSRRRRPRTFGEDPWVQGCCGVPMLLSFVVYIVGLTACINFFIFGGGLGEGMVYGLIVLGGIVGFLYAVYKRYGPP